MRIKFNSDDELRLYKTTEIPSTTIVVTAAFHENKKVFLDECLYKLWTPKLSCTTKKQKYNL